MKDEKTHHKKWKKVTFRLSLTIVILIAVVIIFISPIAKYLVEKYDKKYLGREVTLNWVYVNPFTGYVHLDNLKIYEAANDTVFFAASGLTANFAMSKILSKTYEISSLKIDSPKGTIIRHKNVFNFSDLIERFSSKDTIVVAIKKEPVHFNILNCEITDGIFYFSEPNTPINYSLIKVNFKTDGKYWDRDTINGKLSLQSGIGSGDIKTDFLINVKTLDYKFAAIVTKFNLGVMNQYLKELASYGSVRGYVNADIKAKGNFKSKEHIDGQGRIAINDFHFGKDSLNDYVSYKKLTLAIIQLAPANKKYLFDTVKLQEPYFKYEKYDHLDNLQNMFGNKGAKVKAVKNNPEKFNLIITISQYVQTLFKNFFKSDYKINSFALVDGNIKFNDFSINEKFSASLDPLNIKSDSVDNKKKLVNVYLKSGIKPYGFISVSLSIDPRTNNDFDLNYKLQKIPVPLFNPYIITYTSFPLNRGTVELFGNWQVRNDVIESNNHLIIIDPRISKRIRKKDTRWLPLPLIMFFVRERGNVIDYEIPITGDLKDPKFHLKDAIIDVIENIFIKPATTPYRFEVKSTEIEIEKSHSLVWYRRQTTLTKKQEKFLSKISNFLKNNPEASILVHPMTFNNKEKENILFFEAKKKYYQSYNEKSQKFMTPEDSLVIEKISPKDAGFIKYLDIHIKDSLLFTVQEKCYRLVGEDLLNNQFNKLTENRKNVFMNYFKEQETNNQIKIFNSKSTTPFNGFSYYKISYKGEMPQSLLEAYQQLNDFNDNEPREKYKKFRSKKSFKDVP